MRFALIFVVVFALLSSQALAISVTPAKYETNSDTSFTFSVLNNADTEIVVGYSGTLAEGASGPRTLDLKKDESQEFTVEIDPEGLSPGTHELQIRVRTESSGGQLGAAAVLVPIVRYTQAYDGPWVEASLAAPNWQTPSTATLMLENKGSGVATITGVALYGGEEELDGIIVPALGVSRQTIESPKQPGTYELEITLSGDGVQDEKLTQTVYVGTPSFTIEKIEARGTPGAVMRLDLDLGADWIGELPYTVTGTVHGADRSWVLDPVESKLGEPLELFWESENADYGLYDLEITVQTPGTQNQLSTEFELRRPLVPGANNTVVVVVLVLLIVLLALFMGRLLLFKNK